MRYLPYYLIFFLVLAFLFELDFVFYILYIFGALYVIGLWYPPYIMRHLRVERRFSRRAFLGEYLPVTVYVHNESRLPIPWLQIRDTIPLRLRADPQRSEAVAIEGRGTVSTSYRVWAGRRGYYQLGPLQLTLGDIFGFKEIAGRAPAGYLTIYPRILPLHQLGLPSRLPFGTIGSHQRLFEDPARPMGVRNYRPGDSLRRINWKASAHTDDLLVKTLEPAISLEAMVLLNLNLDDFGRRARYDGPEWNVVVAASLVAHLVDRRQSVGMATNGIDPLRNRAGEALDFDEESGRLLRHAQDDSFAEDMPAIVKPQRGRAHLMKILEILARVEAEEREVPFARWLPGACVNLTWGVTLLVITSQANLETSQALHRLVRAGFNPQLVVTQPTAHFGQVRERARRLGYRAYLVTEEKDLKAWQNRRRERLMYG
jgi:uncharacterized protein (DUF58 family)